MIVLFILGTIFGFIATFFIVAISILLIIDKIEKREARKWK